MQIVARLLDSEEHAVEAAIPDVAEDAVVIINELVGALKQFSDPNYQWSGRPTPDTFARGQAAVRMAETGHLEAHSTPARIQFNKNFMVGDRVCFGRGPFEFIGIVTDVKGSCVEVKGVEAGCLKPEFSTEIISALDRLEVLDDSEWDAKVLYEPAFAGAMSKEAFLRLRKELDEFKSGASVDVGAKQAAYVIKEVLMFSPWDMDPDTREVISKRQARQFSQSKLAC